jgi:acyl-CoA thioesterase FadM
MLQAVIRYRASARFDDPLDVNAWVLEVSEPQFRFAYEIQRHADQVVIATSETVHTWTDPESDTGVHFPDWLRAALHQLRD